MKKKFTEVQRIARKILQDYVITHSITWDLLTALKHTQYGQQMPLRKTYETNPSNFLSSDEYHEHVKSAILEHVEFLLLRLEQDEISLFQKIIENKQMEFTLIDFRRADSLFASGFIFLVMENQIPVAVVPKEVEAVYRAIDQEKFVSQKEKIDLIYQYAVASVNLYGVIHLNELSKIYNQQNEESITVDFLRSVLKYYAVEEPLGLFQNDYFKPEHFVNIEDGTEDLLATQSGKERYIPEKSEFLRNTVELYMKPSKEYSELETFFKIRVKDEEEFTKMMNELKFNLKFIKQMDLLLNTVAQYVAIPESTDEMGKLEDLLTKLVNITGQWELLGYAESDIRTQ